MHCQDPAQSFLCAISLPPWPPQPAAHLETIALSLPTPDFFFLQRLIFFFLEQWHAQLPPPPSGPQFQRRQRGRVWNLPQLRVSVRQAWTKEPAPSTKEKQVQQKPSLMPWLRIIELWPKCPMVPRGLNICFKFRFLAFLFFSFFLFLINSQGIVNTLVTPNGFLLKFQGASVFCLWSELCLTYFCHDRVENYPALLEAEGRVDSSMPPLEETITSFWVAHRKMEKQSRASSEICVAHLV